MNDDIDSLHYANHLCNAYGFDTIAAGATLAVAIEERHVREAILERRKKVKSRTPKSRRGYHRVSQGREQPRTVH